MQFLELKVPPPVAGLVMAILMWLTARAVPTVGFILPQRKGLVLGLVVAGVCVSVLGVASFRRARTTVNPLKPERSSCLVTSDIYRYTRNPMYLGLLLILLGWAVFLANLVAFIFLPGFIAYLNRFQIRPEERVLASVFGQDFANYRSKVRQWL
jgi:protein-S-isoprenylcysteine O-methyltransferase Ste14